MTARVYIETSIVSYLSARPSRDIVVAAHQALTRRWWRGRASYSVFVSQVVLDEAALGDPAVRTRRLRALRGIPRLALTAEATDLAGELVRRGALPKKATVDAFHIGIAAAHQVDYLLTWNCKHLPQQSTRDRIIEALQDLPKDATFDDAIERLVFLAKIEAGLAELDAGKGIPHDEARRRLGL